MVADSDIIRPERWSEAAKEYDSAAMTVTYPAAALAIEAVNETLSFDQTNTYVLDNGAGSGALTIELSKRFPSVPIIATDISADMLAKLDRVGLDNAETRLLDAMKLKSLLHRYSQVSKHGGFSHTFSMFMIHFVPDPDECLRQMIAVTKPGGLVCLGVWGRQMGMMDVLAETFIDIDPTYESMNVFDGLKPFPQTEQALRAKFEALGLQNVQVDTNFHGPGEKGLERMVNYLFDGRNPAAVRLMDRWNAIHPEIGLTPVRQQMMQRVERYFKTCPHVLDTETVTVLGIVR